MALRVISLRRSECPFLGVFSAAHARKFALGDVAWVIADARLYPSGILSFRVIPQGTSIVRLRRSLMATGDLRAFRDAAPLRLCRLPRMCWLVPHQLQNAVPVLPALIRRVRSVIGKAICAGSRSADFKASTTLAAFSESLMNVNLPTN